MSARTDFGPGPRARIAGAVYLAYFAAAIGSHLPAIQGVASVFEVLTATSILLYVCVTVLLYRLLAVVNGRVSFAAAACSLVGCALMTLAWLDRGGVGLTYLLFFGVYCMTLGYLIVRSTFLPRWLGVLLVAAGCGWVIAPFRPFDVLGVALVETFGVVAEGCLMLWLLIAGVNVTRWRDQAARARR